MIEVKKILVVVADSSQARFYLAHGPHSLTKLDDLYNPQGRLKEHELTNKGHDVNTRPYESKDSKKQHDKQNFSKLVVVKIEQLSSEAKITEVCIFAPAKFLGDINKDKLRKHLKVTEIAKDVTRVDNKQLQHFISEVPLSFLPNPESSNARTHR